MERRLPRHPVSWVLAGNALVWGIDGLAQSWLVFALRGEEALPGATAAFWFLSRFGAWLLIGLPLLIPVIIGAARATTPLFAAAGAGALPGKWLAVLGLYDVIIGLIAIAVFDFLLED